jgi:hypothetical protein
VRQRDDPAAQTEPPFEHLGIARTLWRAVVKQDDAFADRHRACRPGNHGYWRFQVDDVEQAKPVEQHGHVASSDHDGGTGVKGLDDLIPTAPDAVALARIPSFLEFRVDPSDVNEMLSVERADGSNRRSTVRLDEAILPGPFQEVADRFETQSQSCSVQILKALEFILTLAQGTRQGLVLADHLFGSSVQAEVDQRSPDVKSQLLRLLLSLLPAGAHDRQRLPTSEGVERRREVRLEALRAQQDDASHGTP